MNCSNDYFTVNNVIVQYCCCFLSDTPIPFPICLLRGNFALKDLTYSETIRQIDICHWNLMCIDENALPPGE